MLHLWSRAAGAAALASILATPPRLFAAETPKPGHDHEEEMVVTATPLDRSADELAMPVDVFGREHLLEHLGSSLGETLAGEPGIATTGFAPGASNPIIRGQGSFRVRTLENGIGTHDVSMLSEDHGLPVNPLVQRSVEVVRGPATLRYGGGAIAGVINSISDRVPAQRRERPLEGELFGAYASNADERDAALLLDGSRGPLALHLDAMSRDSRDFERAGRSTTEANSETDGYSLAAGAAWIGDRGRLGVGVSRFADAYGIPAPEDPARPISIDLEADRSMLEGDLEEPLPGISALRLRGAFTRYAHDELEGPVVGSSFDNRQYEARLEALHEPLLGASGALGLHVITRDLDASGEGGALLAPSDTRAQGVYLFEERPLDARWTLQFGARAEHADVRGTGADDRERSRSFNPLSGSLGAVFALSDETSLGLAATSSQRAPDTLELFARGPHEASETYELGDPALDAETVRSLDLTLRSDQERGSGEISVFYMDYSNFTWGRFTGNSRDDDGTLYLGDPDAGELREVRFDQGDAEFWGAEAEGHLDLVSFAGGGIGVDARIDFVRARVSGEDVPRIPPLRLGAGVSFSHPRARARIGVRRVEEQDEVGAFETRTGAYTLLEASLSVPLREGLELSLTGTNLTDEVGRNHVSIKKDDVALPGRDLRVALRATF